MSHHHSISGANPEDLDNMLQLALNEGWPVDVSTTQVLYNHDPTGFIVTKSTSGEVSGCIVVTNWDDHASFIGFFIVVPKCRGLGVGKLLWNAAMLHAGRRTMRMEAVPVMEPWYQKNGFIPLRHTVALRHPSASELVKALTKTNECETSVCLLSEALEKESADRPVGDRLLIADRAALGYSRRPFIQSWAGQVDRVTSVILHDLHIDSPRGSDQPPRVDHGAISFATMAKVKGPESPILRIGPIQAGSEEELWSLVGRCLAEVTFDGPLDCFVIADSPIYNAMVRHGWAPTAPPTTCMASALLLSESPPSYHAISHLEF